MTHLKVPPRLKKNPSGLLLPGLKPSNRGLTPRLNSTPSRPVRSSAPCFRSNDDRNPPFVLIASTPLCIAFVCVSSLAGKLQPSVQPQPTASTSARSEGQVIQAVRTTAYTHSEADHLQYGARTAVGTQLKAGTIRSAAADWSVYPLGTVFQIQGDPSVYVVDDYGRALVGTRTIDIYQPTTNLMNLWGTRNVNIRVLRWGSPAKSLAVLKPRAYKAQHVREMISRLQPQVRPS